MNNYNLQFLQF